MINEPRYSCLELHVNASLSQEMNPKALVQELVGSTSEIQVKLIHRKFR